MSALFRLAGAKNTTAHRGMLRTDAPDDPIGLGSFAVDIRWV